ncbi:TonB-dependent receptor plug domain-containing protein [Sphingomonas sp. S-NIH.Pt15_0812]|uniref:TonB-dependent receptor plug domain-containing protein n=1 Tax=Sphingomonas sp. S-NIH.Pt15_0812 TaxID=1920129 RepID=UPI000F7F4CF8|nr:TonB-dependent receptor plug domain-containing protein [Sphingomonas sp. S-NIH.Pt15_0812]RSU45863.1 TonB-dependent receptor [Sphingomonas sp. S-NIH.Pt15_0812]
MNKWWAASLAILAIPNPVRAQQAAPPAGVPTSTPTPTAGSQEAEPEADDAGEDIVVTGSRKLPGSVIGDIPPDQTLGAADIRSYGVSSVSDLLNELSPQTTSGRGQGGAPVVLLNGRRISGFQEIRDIPTEAIQRVEILPEEVSLKYGYSADQKVVNIVLRRRFRAATLEAADRVPTAGGRNDAQGEADLLAIRRDTRTNLHLEYERATPLTEAERGIDPRASDDPGATNFDQTPYRTLLSSTRNFSANGIVARPVLGVSATLNGRYELSDSTSRFGLPGVTLTGPDGTAVTRYVDDGSVLPLAQRSTSATTHLGSTLNGLLGGGWNWSFTGNYDRVASTTLTDTGLDPSGFQARLDAGAAGVDDPFRPGDLNAFAANRARSVSSQGGGDLLVTGSPFRLPAGEVTTSLRAGANTSDFSADSFRNGVSSSGGVARDSANGQANIDLPIASKSRGVLGAIGNLSLNGNLSVNHLSDFGTLLTTGYGVNWAPIPAVRIIASATDQENAPTAQQLGNPTIATPGVRIFDYVRGTTATVTTVTGGNPALVSNERHVKKIGVTVKPWAATDLTLTANYVDSRTDNPIQGFPVATAAIEAAFPDRFTRDGDGTLLRIDTRPVNFARAESSQLRWGINFSHALKSRVQRELEAYRNGTGPNPFAGLRPPGGGERRAGGDGPPPGGPDGGAPGAGGPGGPGGGGRGFGGGGYRGGGFGGRGQGGGRLQFAVYHTWNFTNRLLVANGGPSLDLLNGDAISASGGQSRHEVEGQAGYVNNGLGARLSLNYQSPTRVNGLTSADTLAFSDLTTLDLRLFADLGGRLDWVRAHPWMRGARVTLSVGNLFNQRQRVRDADGTTPVSYQPGYLDPLGRSVRLSIRKLFF